MPPEDYIGLEQGNFEERIDAVVEEMRNLNISSIVIVQDSVAIGMGDPVTPKSEFSSVSEEAAKQIMEHYRENKATDRI